MKQSIENQIKETFESWDEQKSDIGFNKSELWASMNRDKKRSIILLPWLRVASIALILLLSSALCHSLWIQKDIKLNQKRMALEIIQLKQNTAIKHEPIIETKIVYETQIKEVESEAKKVAYQKLIAEFKNLEHENIELKNKTILLSENYSHLSDSLNVQQRIWVEREDHYAQQIQELNSISPSTDFEFEIDEQALMAFSNSKMDNKNISKPQEQKRTIEFKYNSQVLKTSGSIFKNLFKN